MNKQVNLDSVEWVLVMDALRIATDRATNLELERATDFERIRDSIRVQINP